MRGKLSLFCVTVVGFYDRQKKSAKRGRISKHFNGVEKIFLSGLAMLYTR